ncbi:MAG: hypothetical protein QOC71_1543, partial [Thermoplasmata archaeon]|nr:hypothetical protein [Thermoplasmata archaeon]
LAGCSFKGETKDDGGDSDGGVSVGGDGDNNDDKNSPSASIGAVVSVLGVALLARRKMMG